MAKLLGRAPSINVRKVLWTCAEIGLAPAWEPWGTPELPLSHPDFQRLNPKGLVPVWVEDGLTLTESNTICRYLAQRHGRTDLLPADAAGRARVEEWMDWQVSDLNNAWRHAFMALVRRDPAFADPEQVRRSTLAWHGCMQLLDSTLARTGAYVLGPQLTLADVVLGLSVHRWRQAPLAERPELPALAAYYERLCERPGFQRHGRDGGP